MKTPTKRGGVRPGAGRPALPASERAVGVTMRVRPAIAAKFAAYCAARGASQAATFSAWVGGLRYAARGLK
jgi:hypothetical protein